MIFARRLLWIIIITSLYNTFVGYPHNRIPVGNGLREETGLFDSDRCLELIFTADVDSLLNDTGNNPSYHYVRINYKNENSQWVELNGEIRVRGNFRKRSENCDFPPFKLKFDKEECEHTIFDNIKEIKLVTHCQTNIPDYEQYVLQEFLIYKLYNILSEFSYKVRLLKVTYMDSRNKEYKVEKFAFFIEDEENMAKRLNGNILDIETVNPENVDQAQFLLVAFFEYLIINTDWSVPIMHNITLLSLDYFKPPVPVPFDFDWSGFINIPYIIPTVAGLKTRIPERIYSGPCAKKRDLEKITRFFQSKKQEILDMYTHFPYLDNEYKAATLNNIRIFYEIMEDKYIFRSVFVDQCTE